MKVKIILETLRNSNKDISTRLIFFERYNKVNINIPVALAYIQL